METIKLDKNGVPILSTNDLELKAEEIISYFGKEVLDEPQSTPLIKYIKIINEKFKIYIGLNKPLGETKSGKKILGITRLKPLEIHVDVSLVNDDSRFRFVLGHEFGHLVCHRNINLKQTGYDEQEITDTEYDVVTGKKNLNSPRDWIEWQANYFSSAILMPRETIMGAVIKKQQEVGIKRNIGRIILESKNYNLKDYIDIQEYLKGIFMVNSTNIEIRLKNLGILIDRRDHNIKHVSELFTTE